MSKLEELRAKAEELLEKVENAESIAEVSKFTAELDGVVGEYTVESKIICYEELKAADNPMHAAILKFYFPSIKVKTSVDKDTGIITRSLEDCLKAIDLKDFHDKVKGGIGADKLWLYKIEKLNYLLTARTAKQLGDDKFAEMLSKNKDAYIMQKISRDIDMGKTPMSNTALLKVLKDIVSAMLGEEYQAMNYDVNYLIMAYAQDNKKSKTAVTVANHSTLRGYLKKVCYRILTNGKGYTVESREFKAE